MMSNDVNQSACDELMPIFQATNEALSEWTGEGNLQFPKLLEKLALKLNWGEKQLRESDALVRWYVRRHPDWHVTRGAHGGIMRASEKQKKEDEKQKKEAANLAKDLAKKQMQDALEAKEQAAVAAKAAMSVGNGTVAISQITE